MSARRVALGLFVVAAVVLSWSLLASHDTSRDGDGESAAPGVLVAPRDELRVASPVDAPVAAATALVGAASPVADQLDELVNDLDELRVSGRSDLDSLGLERVRQLVLTLAGADQRAEGIRALEQRFDARGFPDEAHAWTSARLLVALGGLGAGEAVMDRWGQVPADQRADVLLGLVWDPLREGGGLAFPVADLDTLIPQSPLLPVATGRLAPAAAQPLLERLARELPASPESPQLRDAAIVALGVGIDALPAPALAFGAFLEQELPTPQSALRPVLFVLMRARGDAAMRLLAGLERRHAALDAHERWPFGGQPYIDEIVRVENVARRPETDSPPWPEPAASAASSADKRLHAAFSLLAWADGGACARSSRVVRFATGDRINALIGGERDVAVANILAHAVMLTGSNYTPAADDPFLQQFGR